MDLFVFHLKRNYLVKNGSVPFCCIPQKASLLPETGPQFGPVKETNMKKKATDES